MKTKSAFVAIVGRPNVGKSSLLNAFVGEKVAIVTSKPQTTRTRVTGVLTNGDTQLVFVDTPGMHSPKTKLSHYMIKQIRESVADVDVAVMVCEPTGPVFESERELISRFSELRIPAILAINKIDTLPRKDMMMEKLAALSALYDFSEVVPISVKQRDGLDILLEKISAFAAESPHFFEDDAYTDQTERTIISELIREKLLEALADELPHGVAIGIESMKERGDSGLMDIHAVIYCEKDSHKGMIIGKDGVMLKKIASLARIDIEEFLACRVNLKCWVRVKESWRNREGLIKEFGFQ